MLSREEILLILDRLKWEPMFEDRSLVLATKRSGGYSDDRAIDTLEAKLSIMLEVASRKP